MSATTFLYALCEPGTRSVRYIGKANNPKKRLTVHIAFAKRGVKKSHVLHWLRKLLSNGTKPELFIIGEIPLSGWEDYEKNAIAAARALGMAVTNTTDGGEGASGLVGEKSPMFGRKHTSETKAKISRTHIGIKHTSETKAHLARLQTGRKATPEACAKMSAFWLNRKSSRNTSGFVGVCRMGNKWGARYYDAGKTHHVGRFFKIEDAVFARSLAIANL